MANSTRVTFLGHSTLLIETDGLRVLTDPLLRNRVTILRRTGPAIDPQWYQDIDLVLISHMHYDHLDFASLRKIGGQFTVVMPAQAAPVLEQHGFKRHQGIHIGEALTFGTLTIKATSADHVRKRHPLGPEADCLGFMLHGGVKIYYPGDTRLFPEMAELAEDLDLAFLPVWGWGPDRGRMHMGPVEAVEALKLLKPRMAVPIHWGTYTPFWLSWLKAAYAYQYIPPLEFAALAEEAMPQVKVRILETGESLQVGDA